MAEIRVEGLHKSFGDFAAVKDSTFTIKDGEFFCLLGPSGCGKTTTLRLIAGLELPTSGQILLDGEDVTFKRASQRDVAMVFQLFALYPHMNVRANIAYPLRCAGLSQRQIEGKVAEIACILRIEHLLDRRVSGLSGGDRQRVALGRAIVREPKAFMMDEPLGALDAEFRHVMCGELRALHNRLHATTVYVTHDQLEAMSMADTIAVMNLGEIEQLASPQEIYDRPASMFVADFIGSPPMSFIPFRGSLQGGATTVTIAGAEVPIPAAREEVAEADLVLGVRPEHVVLSDGSALRGEIYGSEYLGTTQIVTVRREEAMIHARVTAHIAVKVGESVGLAFKPAKLSLFRAATGRAIRTALHEVGRHG
jgi:multiple sugar transport system ATP-binding protein